MNPIRQLADLTPQQSEAAIQSGAVLVLAGAGTGKTRTLTQAVVHRIEARGVPASRILAVTFTNKAAGEMAVRIRTALGGEGAPHWIGTFHGLGARQLRNDPEIAGLRPGFDIIDADDSRRIVKRVLKAMNLRGGEEIHVARPRSTEDDVQPAVQVQGQPDRTTGPAPDPGPRPVEPQNSNHQTFRF